MTDELDAELAAWAESDAPVTVPGRILRGAAARAAGRRALAWAGYPNVEAGRITRAGTGRSQTGNLRHRQVRLDVVTDARRDDENPEWVWPWSLSWSSSIPLSLTR